MSKTAKYIFEKSTIYLERCDQFHVPSFFEINLPTINKIDNLNIECNLVITKIMSNGKNIHIIGIWIESLKIKFCCTKKSYDLYNYKEELILYSPEKIDEFLQKIKNNFLPNMKLDKVYGKLILITNNGEKIIQEENVGEDIFGFEYSNYDSCSVCYDSTYTHTACNHPLCINCWNKIDNDLCPICRNVLIMHDGKENKKYDEDEDDEDEDDEDEDEGDDD